MQTLLDNQKKAIAKLQKYKVGALFMEPGTGKTRAVIELVKSVKDIDYVCYLAPYRTIKADNYNDGIIAEVEKWGGFNCDCEFTGIESFSNSDRIYLDVYSKLEKVKKPFLILDESLKIKNQNAKRTKRLLQLSKLVDYKLILNGTPVSKNLLDVWSQMEFLSSKILNMGSAEYKNTFVEYTTITKRLGSKSIKKEFINKYHNIDYLYSLINPFVFDAKLDIDQNKQYIEINFDLTKEEKDKHEYIKENYLNDEFLAMNNNNIFLQITQKLQHNYSNTDDKYKIVNKLLYENPNENFIIYAKYIDTQEALTDAYPDCLILSYQKHSYGLNLQNYNRVIFWDKVWDYALIDQAEHRIYRTGQTQDCVFYSLTGNVGLEKMISKNVAKKQDILAYFKKKSVKQLMEKL